MIVRSSVTSGQERFVFRDAGSLFDCLDISPDGNTIAAANLQGMAWTWHAGPDEDDPCDLPRPARGQDSSNTECL